MREYAAFTGELGPEGMHINHEDGRPLFHAALDGELKVFGPTGETIFTTNTDTNSKGESAEVVRLLDEAYEEEGFGFFAINAFYQIAKTISELVNIPPEVIAELMENPDDSSKPH